MKFPADENFNNDILRGVWRRIPDANFIRVQDTEISGADDPRVLEYAQNRVISSSRTMSTLCAATSMIALQQNSPAPGLFLVHKQTPIGEVIDALELIILASDESEWLGQATYIP